MVTAMMPMAIVIATTTATTTVTGMGTIMVTAIAMGTITSIAIIPAMTTARRVDLERHDRHCSCQHRILPPSLRLASHPVSVASTSNPFRGRCWNKHRILTQN
jgi:hypothetical protein